MSDERWREKYYDKVAELNQVEKKLFECANSKADEFLKYRHALRENEFLRATIQTVDFVAKDRVEELRKLGEDYRKLNAAVAEAEETIHDEFCESTGCHPLHLKVKQLSR